MSVPMTALPNQQAPVTLSQLREALAFVTDQYDKAVDAGTDVLEWLWEAVQGDFNQERSTGQIVFDAAISLIPGVDQVCDVRDLIANCKQINEDKTNTWAWVSLGLTLIGLFPSLGSVVKGVLKIFFLFVRRTGGNAVAKAVDEAMTWVITFLRKKDVQDYIRRLKWDRIFFELAKGVKEVRAMLSVGALLQAFDRGIALMRNLLRYVLDLPFIGGRAQKAIDLVVGIRSIADQHLRQALRPLQDALDVIIQRLELEDLVQRRGIVNVGNVHFRGNLPETRAVALMRAAEPPPPWLSKGEPKDFKPLPPEMHRTEVDEAAKEGYPWLSDDQISSFAPGMKTDILRGPMRLYRVVSPGNMAAGSDWVTEEVWQQITRVPDPKTAWRKHLAVWPDWNADGQFVVYDLKPGEELKVWRGPAAAQTKKKTELPNRYLEGGWEQIKFHTGVPNDGRFGDTAGYYERDAAGHLARTDLDYGRYKTLPPEEQAKHEFLRERINHPAISGPFDTGWGYTDFDAQLMDAKLGLPAMPGQTSQTRK